MRSALGSGILTLSISLLSCGPNDVAELGGEDGLDVGLEQSLESGVPNQFIAKLYTEALGRAPDPSGWKAYTGYFRSTGCSRATLEFVAKSFFSSDEFTSRNHAPEEQVLMLYRALLSREPDAPGYASHLSALRRGTLAERVLVFTQSPEFSARVSATCSQLPTGWGRALAVPLPLGSAEGFQGAAAGKTEADLQQLLDARRGLGGTVYLAPRALVQVKAGLVVPAGVTLATVGAPSPRHYARMGRLVRSEPLEGKPVVRLEAGAALTSVWVDGQTNRVSGAGGRSHDVNIMGDRVQVTGCRLSDGQGTSLYLAGDRDGVPCRSATVARNLITGYGATYMGEVERWMDGITNRCAGATIEDNQIVDATDVGIVTFHPGVGVQASTVRRNLIVAAGNPMVAGIGIDPETGFGPQPGTRFSFSGFLAADNVLWTSSTAHMGIVLTLGTRAWFSDGVAVGGRVLNNTTGELSARVNNGILIATMDGPTVQGNVLRLDVQKISNCATGASLASRDSTNLGNVQAFTWVDTSKVTSCVAHRWP